MARATKRNTPSTLMVEIAKHSGWTLYKINESEWSARSLYHHFSVNVYALTDGGYRYRVSGVDYGRDGDYQTLSAAIRRLG
jgi:hypothetical protein